MYFSFITVARFQDIYFLALAILIACGFVRSYEFIPKSYTFRITALALYLEGLFIDLFHLLLYCTLRSSADDFYLSLTQALFLGCASSSLNLQ